MDSQDFKEYCNEPAFPECVAVAVVGYTDGSNDSVTRYSLKKGLTKLEHYTERILQTLLQDALQKNLKSNGGFTTIDLAKDATQTALATLRNIYNAEFK